MDRRALLKCVFSALPAAGCMSAVDAHSNKHTSVAVTHTRVFAASRNGGNLCPLVLDTEGMIPGATMQRLARKFGQDTAFIVPLGDKGADLHIRYFVPDHEMGVSGHATIAAVTVALRAKALDHNPIRIQTVSGLFEANWTRHSDDYRVTLGQNPPIFGRTTAPERVARVLGIQVDDIAFGESPVQSVSVSRAKLLVPLRDSRILNHLTSDFEALWRLCEEERVTGLYPFTRHTEHKNIDAEARQFPLRAGFPEDAATGVAAAALAAYMAHYDLANRAGRHEFRIAQGYAMGAPSLIDSIAECADGKVTKTAIRGTARIVAQERVSL
jgi:PhzF family phenazine biosynthesis protein